MTEIKASEDREVPITDPEEVVSNVKSWAISAGCMTQWTWVVIYRGEEGASYYAEYGADKGVHGWGTVDLGRVQLLALVPIKPGIPAHEIAFQAGDGRVPVFFRRITVAADGYIDPALLARTIHCIGWTKGKEEHYQFYFDDGSSVSSGDINGV